MKRLFFIIILSITLSGLSSTSFAQEKYFHELKGMEDSTGTTHLFYRLFDSKTTTCTDMGGYTSNISYIKDHIYHFDTATLKDSVEFRAYNSINYGCDEFWYDTERFLFTDRHPDSTFAIKSIIGGLFGGFSFPITEEHEFDLNVGNPLGLSLDRKHNEIIITTPIQFLVIKATNRVEDLLKKSFRYPIKSDTSWINYRNINDVPDSLLIDFTVIGINPYKEGRYIGIQDSNIVLSADYGSTYTPILKSPWEEWEIYGSRFEDIHFDADSNSFYFTIGNGELYLAKHEAETWSINEISEGSASFQFTIQSEESGNYYFSYEDSLFHAREFGESTSLMITFPYKITGLYKKPDSDILYVLTTEELMEVNTETLETTSLKKIPVSNEPEQNEIPTQVSLQQNYPNPFNPSTVISYQLTGNSLVNLEVFDVTGRKVAVLVNDEQRTAGTHQVTFNAGNLSSGVYFYRLETTGQVLTKKMLLLK